MGVCDDESVLNKETTTGLIYGNQTTVRVYNNTTFDLLNFVLTSFDWATRYGSTTGSLIIYLVNRTLFTSLLLNLF